MLTFSNPFIPTRCLYLSNAYWMALSRAVHDSCMTRSCRILAEQERMLYFSNCTFDVGGIGGDKVRKDSTPQLTCVVARAKLF